MVCGGAVTISDIFPLGYSEGELEVTTNPTCTAEGVSQTSCKVCGVTVTTNQIPALGHTFGDWSLKTEPTGETEGAKERVCVVCSAVESEAIEKLASNIADGNYSASLNTSGAYFPYLSSFKGELITEKLTADEIAALIPVSSYGKDYTILDVWSFTFLLSSGEAFTPTAEITYSFTYSLPQTEYASFLIYDSQQGMYTPVAEGETITFTCMTSGRFVLVGEAIPEETTSEETTADTIPEETTVIQDTSAEDTTNTPASSVLPSGSGTKAIIVALLIVAVILLIIMGIVIYYYVSMQYYR
jgi:hypothetical protein